MIFSTISILPLLYKWFIYLLHTLLQLQQATKVAQLICMELTEPLPVAPSSHLHPNEKNNIINYPINCAATGVI